MGKDWPIFYICIKKKINQLKIDINLVKKNQSTCNTSNAVQQNAQDRIQIPVKLKSEKWLSHKFLT